MCGVSVCSFTGLDLVDHGVTVCSLAVLNLAERGVIVRYFSLPELLEQGPYQGCWYRRILVFMISLSLDGRSW